MIDGGGIKELCLLQMSASGHALAIDDLMMQGQASGSIGAAKFVLGHTDGQPRLFRINPTVAAGTFAMGNASKLRELIGVGATAAREFSPIFRSVFLGGPREGLHSYSSPVREATPFNAGARRVHRKTSIVRACSQGRGNRWSERRTC